jgi:predicted RNA methylase
VLFASSSKPTAVASLPYTKNGFQILVSVPRRSLGHALERFSEEVERRVVHLGRMTRGRPFRVVAHVDGRLVSLPPTERRRLESTLARITGSPIQARGGAHEFWVIGRRELPRFLLGWRLPQPSRPLPVAGALSAGLSDLLTRASQPRDDDIFLDPFAGSGALGAARLAYPSRIVYLSDAAGVSSQATRSARSRVRYLREDALSLPSLDDGHISAIVTDPPWGEFDPAVGDYGAFLAGMWTSFARVLDRACARVVILMARRRAGDTIAAAAVVAYAVDARYDILVNGHPATAIRFVPR